ncbi:MAG TPA: lysine exporter LysO family protein [Sediminispirochaeta sp.]|nr:lysine exporter LysO family protein [Sediminispirochaeta sp.]
METLGSLLIIFSFLFAGMAGAHFKILPVTGYLDRIMNVALAALLFSMGLRIGLLDSVTSQLLRIGILSLSFAAVTVAGTVAALMLVLVILRRHRDLDGSDGHEPKQDGPLGLGEPLRLFGFVVAGFLCGYFLPYFDWFREVYTSYLLYALLFLIGVQMVRNEVNLKQAMLHPLTFLIPLGTVIGSLAGSALLAAAFDLELGKALSLAAGFGWYSLSGVLITEMGDPVLGAAGFLINVIREAIALLLIPLLAKLRLSEAAIGVGGATSMDVTLPLIERSCGTAYVPMAIVNGAVLSMLVPFLVPFFFSIA